ncbi:MAG: hypothetical protein GX622_02415 [Bacteroidales bacterium]|nr:hypothetical protein [Bacteroidales bacterium]
MKSRILIAMIMALVTIILIAVAVWFVFGFNTKPGKVMSVNSPQGTYEAYVTENPSIDPPNQGLFISKTGTGDFRLVAHLPEDIESAQKLYWSKDGTRAIFVTNWHLFITDVQNLNTRKISLNPDWWKWQEGKKTFTSSGTSVVMEELILTGSDSLTYRTNLMTQPVTVTLTGL